MNGIAASSGAGGNGGESLIFQGEPRSRRPWRLAAILLLSFLGHALSFYVLQVAYTPTASLLPPPTQVTFLPPASPENLALARWLTIADPALIAAAPAPTADQVFDTLRFHYQPSYATAAPSFRDVKAPAALAMGESSDSPRPAPMPPLSTPVAGAPARLSASPGRTELVWSGDLDALVPTGLPPISFVSRQGPKPLEPTVFIVGVRPGGGQPWLFRQPPSVSPGQTSAGDDPAADEYARDYLARIPFKSPPPADPAGEAGATVWGWATFYWGTQAYP